MAKEKNKDNIPFIVFEEFKGFMTKWNPGSPRARGYLVGESKNVVVNDANVIEPRRGSQILGAANATSAGIQSMGKFVPSTGDEILLRSYGTVLQFYHRTNKVWTDLVTGLTTGLTFGFEMDEISTDGKPYLYYCNGIENYQRWDGVETPSTPTQYASAPKGNILHRTDNARMIVAGVPTTPAAIYVSKTNDPTTFTFSSPRVATDGAVINVGNVITGLGQLGEKIYWLCKRIIGWIRFTQIPTGVTTGAFEGYDFLEIRPEADGGSTGDDIGCVSQLAVMKFDNKILFISPSGMIKDLGSVVSHSVFQANYIGEPIKPDLDDADLETKGAGIIFQGKAYIAGRKDSNSTHNDRIWVYDIIHSQWEAPLNKNANCFLVANNKLYYGSSINPEVYEMEVEDLYSDNYNAGATPELYPIFADAYTHRESFGLPTEKKKLYELYLEGTIKSNTIITVEVLLDEAGYSGKMTGTIDGTNTDIVFKSATKNLLGLRMLGISLLGSDEDASGLNTFRLYLSPVSPVSFHNIQLRFYSNGDGMRWTINKYGVKVDKLNYKDTALIKGLTSS